MIDAISYIVFFVSIAALMYGRHLAYKHGIWDGAFNQTLPHVQRAMRDYDERRADEILNKEPRP